MSSPYAKYTMTFKEFLQDDINLAWFESSIVMSDTDRTQRIQTAIKSMWDAYEISGETIGEFKMFLLDTFTLHKDYYEDMITNYDKEFDYTTGIVRTSETDAKDIHVELPNKKIDENDIYKYPNDANKGNTVITNRDNSLFLRMKREYLRQIRNLYNEFAMKFTDCFIHIF